ncbi:MAG: DUF1778 domain-containing protein [Azonexus sp.]|nr:DUF1778 domain-containing protein [Azonexus sp.]MDP3635826.1 DUF1778 domain-containing protein [Azonexus sp.]MDZ4313246.1 DUF1778 domain-containing protein [Azonexus sp.]
MAQTRLQDATSVSRGRITARVSQHVVDVLELAAGMVGSTLNQFVTQAALEKAEKIVENERTLQMSENTAAWFFNLLDNPPAPSQNLVDAFSRYNARKAANAGSNSTFEFNP